MVGYLLIAVAAYLAIGIVFGVAFVAKGAQAIDPAAEHASIGFRFLILPGSAALWPVLLRRWRRAGGGR